MCARVIPQVRTPTIKTIPEFVNQDIPLLTRQTIIISYSFYIAFCHCHSENIIIKAILKGSHVPFGAMLILLQYVTYRLRGLT